MARIVRYVHDRLLGIRNVPYTNYGLERLFFNGGSHGYIFTFIIGQGPKTRT